MEQTEYRVLEKRNLLTALPTQQKVGQKHQYFSENALLQSENNYFKRTCIVNYCHEQLGCTHNLFDTALLAQQIARVFSNVYLPHKIRISIIGCAYSCTDIKESDLMIRGVNQPVWTEARCTFCGRCARNCPVKAISVLKGKNMRIVNNMACLSCGKCINECPHKAICGKKGLLVAFGGRGARHPISGKEILPLISSKEVLFKIIGITLDFFKRYAVHGERLSSTLYRVGWLKLQQRFDGVIEKK